MTIMDFDPWPMACQMCDNRSKETMNSLKIGDTATYYTERDYPHSGRKCKGKTKTIQTQNDIINLKLKFRENQIFEVRKA